MATVLTRGQFSRLEMDNAPVIGLVAAGAACFALFSVLGKKMQRQPELLVSLYFLAALLASLVALPLLSSFTLPGAGDWLPILLNGILVNGFSYLIWLQALRTTEASFLAPFTFLTPVLSAVYLVALFDEPFHAAYGAGLLLVVVGGLINTRRQPGSSDNAR